MHVLSIGGQVSYRHLPYIPSPFLSLPPSLPLPPSLSLPLLSPPPSPSLSFPSPLPTYTARTYVGQTSQTWTDWRLLSIWLPRIFQWVWLILDTALPWLLRPRASLLQPTAWRSMEEWHRYHRAKIYSSWSLAWPFPCIHFSLSWPTKISSRNGQSNSYRHDTMHIHIAWLMGWHHFRYQRQDLE